MKRIHCNSPTVNAQKLVNVINAYTNQYNATVAAAQANHDSLLSFYTNNYLASLTGFTSLPGGYRRTLPFLDLNQEFEIAAATAEFPIGPVTLVLEIAGYGVWGVTGEVSFGSTLLPSVSGGPKVFAEGRAVPRAGLNVDAYVGLGFSIGIASASVGIGSDVTLVALKAPITGSAALGATRSLAGDSRALNPELNVVGISNLAKKSLANTPAFLKSTYSWGLQGTMAAGAELKLLSGTIDGRLRVRFVFFSRTWKKRMAKFNGLPPKEYRWSGTVNFGEAPDVVSPVIANNGGVPVLNVLQPFGLPEIPQATLSWFPQPVTGWGVVQPGSDEELLQNYTFWGSCAAPVPN